MQTKFNCLQFSTPEPINTTSLDEARSWIGCRLILRKPWLGFERGSACRVMCVVDFGDGLMLWIITDDEHAREIDQLAISDVSALFELAEIDSTNQRISSDKANTSSLVS